MINFVMGDVKGGDWKLVPPKQTSKALLLKLLHNSTKLVYIV